MLGNCVENVRNKMPLVHNITNYVTVNDVANVLLACGGSPIMSDEPMDVEDITSICGGLNINIGTLNQRSIEGMFLAGRKANELGHIVLLDPVGAGASALRTNTALKLMEEICFDVIRGNISEIKIGTGDIRSMRHREIVMGAIRSAAVTESMSAAPTAVTIESKISSSRGDPFDFFSAHNAST